MANWFYYDSFNVKYGPITDDELKALVAQGTITPQTKMENESGMQGRAGQIKGLFPEPSAPSPETYPLSGGQQYEQQPYGQPSYGLPSGTPYPPAEKPAVTLKPPADYLVWSIITTLCCCLPLGVSAIVMSVQAKSAFQVGDYAAAESKSKTAFWCNLIGLIGGIVINGLYIIGQLAAVSNQ